MVTRRHPSFRLYQKDCIEGMERHIADNSIDCVVTSPPYNLGVKYNSYEDNRNWDDFLDWCCEWAEQIHRCLKPDGSLFLNVGNAPSAPLFPHMLLSRLCDEKIERHFILQNTIHWIKSLAVPNRKSTTTGDSSEQEIETTIGHIKPINSSRFINDGHEFIFHLTPKGTTKLDRLAVGVPYADKSNISRWRHTAGQDRKCRGNVWFIPYKTIQNRAKDRPHPATFPTELAVKCIKLHGQTETSTVMDPFLGIGHASFAAIECGVSKFVGFEIDPDYIDVARTEIAERCGKKPSALK